MRSGRVTPSGAVRTFGPEEIIVSKTDPRGRITYANDVFLRVSGYDEPDLLGKPHSVIRHPEMPRAVFGLMWETIEAGQEIFAYVNNLAADGAHYWVLAHVTPTFGPGGRIVGYHSNRRFPQPAAIDAVTPLYADLLAEERRHSSGNSAVAASSQVLAETLEGLGVTYDEWVWRVIAASEKAA